MARTWRRHFIQLLRWLLPRGIFPEEQPADFTGYGQHHGLQCNRFANDLEPADRTISNPPAPTLTAISPSGGPINTATAVTLTGTGFTASSTVALNSQTIPSTFVSPTQLTATFPASSLPPGNVNVTVTTPAPGGGTSSAQVYTNGSFDIE